MCRPDRVRVGFCGRRAMRGPRPRTPQTQPFRFPASRWLVVHGERLHPGGEFASEADDLDPDPVLVEPPQREVGQTRELGPGPVTHFPADVVGLGSRVGRDAIDCSRRCFGQPNPTKLRMPGCEVVEEFVGAAAGVGVHQHFLANPVPTCHGNWAANTFGASAAGPAIVDATVDQPLPWWTGPVVRLTLDTGQCFVLPQRGIDGRAMVRGGGGLPLYRGLDVGVG